MRATEDNKRTTTRRQQAYDNKKNNKRTTTRKTTSVQQQELVVTRGVTPPHPERTRGVTPRHPKNGLGRPMWDSKIGGYKLVTLEERNLKIADDFDLQRELMKKFGLYDAGPFIMGHYMVQIMEDGRHKLVKRENPVNFEFDNDGHARCVKSMQKTYAERIGGLEVETLKERDTMRSVMDNLLCQSIEVGEVASFAGF